MQASIASQQRQGSEERPNNQQIAALQAEKGHLSKVEDQEARYKALATAHEEMQCLGRDVRAKIQVEVNKLRQQNTALLVEVNQYKEQAQQAQRALGLKQSSKGPPL
jgi:hypothetical protein